MGWLDRMADFIDEHFLLIVNGLSCALIVLVIVMIGQWSRRGRNWLLLSFLAGLVGGYRGFAVLAIAWFGSVLLLQFWRWIKPRIVQECPPNLDIDGDDPLLRATVAVSPPHGELRRADDPPLHRADEWGRPDEVDARFVGQFDDATAERIESGHPTIREGD